MKVQVHHVSKPVDNCQMSVSVYYSFSAYFHRPMAGVEANLMVMKSQPQRHVPFIHSAYQGQRVYLGLPLTGSAEYGLSH